MVMAWPTFVQEFDQKNDKKLVEHISNDLYAICNDGTNETLGFFPVAFGNTRSHSTEGAVITNIVPMYRTFRSGVWKEFWQQLSRWNNVTNDAGQLHIHLGPVFDHDLPYGLRDATYR